MPVMLMTPDEVDLWLRSIADAFELQKPADAAIRIVEIERTDRACSLSSRM
ncbi:MAG: hypothetical protein J0H44_02220 [Alphaproteobacteria bacterium]|nr:hypothetical protein [Alphaproteobacteria bacterium]